MTPRRIDTVTRLKAALVAASLASLTAVAANPPLSAQQPISSPDVALLREFEWRPLGPYRAGRASAADGSASDPTSLYVASGGGLWKSLNDGQSWAPVFDAQPVGAVAVAPSRPDVVYLGTGEGIERPDGLIGDGLYRSSDAGRTWTRLGLASARAVSHIAVSPDNPDRLLVGVVAPPTMTDAVRGVFRSTDGGRTFEQVLRADGLFGATTLAIDSASPNTAYAVLAGTPGEARPVAGAGLFKSIDGGSTWRRIGSALPLSDQAGVLSRVTLSVAKSRSSRLFLRLPIGEGAVLYRSDDGGETWPVATPLNLPGMNWGMGDAAIAVHPVNPDQVYVLGSGVQWLSRDGGLQFARTEAPTLGPTDHLWMHPTRPHVMLAWGTGGPRVSVDAGVSWSAPFALPTASLSRLSIDSAFPYRVCGNESSTWAVCVPTRADAGPVTRRDWTVLPDTSGSVAPDTLDPDVIYAGHVTRFDRRTSQLTDVSPPHGTNLSATGDSPLVFSADGRALYYGANMLWRLSTPNQTWTAISPDLTLDADRRAEPPSARTGISAIGLSSVDARTIWVGMAKGEVHRTRDAGVTWTNVSPDSSTPRTSVAAIEVSHFDAASAYLTLRSAPGAGAQVLRTRDGGVTWVSIAAGLPARAHAIREDVFRRGLLFAATDAGVQVSFDDGDTWQSLRLNMPAVAVRDVAVKDADLIVSTAGRGLWLLEDFSPLRQITPAVVNAEAFVFRPSMAVRARRTASVEQTAAEPAPPAAPEGVTLHYMIGPKAVDTVSLEVIESMTGTTLRRFSSDAEDPASRLPTTPGLHRVRWDLRTAPVAIPAGAASPATTLPGVAVVPGVYQVRLTAGNRALRQAISIRLDPRLRVVESDLREQFTLAKSVHDKVREVVTAWRQASPSTAAASALSTSVAGLADASRMLDSADGRPTTALQASVALAMARADAAIATPR